MKDPIVDEVRRVREELARECGYDMHRIFERQRQVFERWRSGQAPFGEAGNRQVPTAAGLKVAEPEGEYRTRKQARP